MRAVIFAGLALVAGTCAAEQSWAEFNGFRPGMPKAEAKKIGYSDCVAAGTGGADVECSAAVRGRFESLSVKSVKLKFSKKNLDRLDEVMVTFAHTRDRVVEALVKRYGQPALDTGNSWVWFQKGDDVIVMRRKQILDASITFGRIPGIEAQVKKSMAAKAAKDAKLKNF